MSPTQVEIIVRLPGLDSKDAQAALNDVLQQVRLNMPDANVELAKVTDTNDAFDSIKIMIEAVYVGVQLYHIVKAVYGKA